MSASHNVPKTAVGTVTVRLNIPQQADVGDPRNRVNTAVYTRMLNLWVLVPIVAVWLGGVEPTSFDVPVIGPMTLPDAFGNSMPLWDMRGNPIRVEIEVQRAIRVGVSVTSRAPKEQ